MSKPITLTEQHLANCRANFERALQQARLTDAQFHFHETFAADKQTATIYFTPEAWTKMAALIQTFDREIAWYGVVQRGEDTTKNDYIVSDIIVYPQTVTGTDVEIDTEAHAKWMEDTYDTDDERMFHLHMQGHSHVNMSTNPSQKDMQHQTDILQMIGDGGFYIFMIWNKSFASTNKIYDLQKNILFENGDIAVKLLGGAQDLDAFLQSAKEMVTVKTATAGNQKKAVNLFDYQFEDDDYDVMNIGNPYGAFGFRGY